jgi:hypothetical protein
MVLNTCSSTDYKVLPLYQTLTVVLPYGNRKKLSFLDSARVETLRHDTILLSRSPRNMNKKYIGKLLFIYIHIQELLAKNLLEHQIDLEPNLLQP